MKRNILILKIGLSSIFTFITLSAFIGGLALIITNGLGAPTVWLEKSVFDTYAIPGVLLVFISLVSLTAASLTIRGIRFYQEFGAIAGFSIIFFEFFQLYILKQSHPLQIFYFLLGVLAIVLLMLLIR